MMKNWLGIVGATVLAVNVMGCSGDPGAPGVAGTVGTNGTNGKDGKDALANPSLNSITPGNAFMGRKETVIISAVGTAWTSVANGDVNFGDGITVSKVTVASETSLVVELSIGNSAKTGRRSVSIKNAGKDIQLKDAFDVQSPLKVVITGTQAQGTILEVTVKNRDLLNAFDTTAVALDPFGLQMEYTNIALDGLPTGVQAQVSSVKDFEATFVLLCDTTVAAGKLNLTLKSGPKGGEQVDFPATDVAEIKARTATPVTMGKDATGTLDVAGTALLSFSSAEQKGILELSSTTSTTGGSIGVAVLPKSGSFTDMLAFSTSYLSFSKPGDSYYAVIWQRAGVDKTAYTLKTITTIPSFLANADDKGDLRANAQTISALPAVIESADLASDKDVDYYEFAVAAADANKAITVMTLPGDKKTDVTLSVLSGSALTTTETSVAADGKTADLDYHEKVTTKGLAAGKYVIKVAASPYQAPGAGMSKYHVFARFQ